MRVGKVFLSCGELVIITLILLVSLDWNQLVLSQTRNEPVNFNWIIALPWDIANSLRAPLGGPVSVVLTAFLACILLFGLLLAPVNYLLGYPARIYHGIRKEGIFGRSLDFDSVSGREPNFDIADILVHLFDELASLKVVFDRDETFSQVRTGRELVVREEGQESRGPGFLDWIFLLVPEGDESCRRLMVCHAHGFLGYLPPPTLKLYTTLSKHFISIPEPYKASIMLGLRDQGECGKVFPCEKNLFHLVRGVIGLIRQKIVKLFPDGTRDRWQPFYSPYTTTTTL